mmetsp:Transcript_29064/g.46780  ORF Transcript_29064/g.46780 Transcript_29064/m.46780 type:complete len:309 (-) Transcript_29064:174-1100(-)
MASAVMRQSAVAAAALALVVLVALLAVSQQGPASAAETKAKEATKRAAVAKAAASIKGLQANVATVMNEERKEGKLARIAMMDKEQKEVRLETDENGLQASAENSDPHDKTKHPHQSIKALKAQIAAAGARADTAKAARKKLQTRLDKDLNQLAHQQFVAHKTGAAPKAAAAKAAAGKRGTKGVAGMASTMAQTLSRQESVLAGMDMQLLALPKVRKALRQSLNSNELKIANEVAKSLGASFNATGIPEAMIAEVAVAQAEKDRDMPLDADAVSPALNFTAPPLADALLKDYEQAQKEVGIDTEHSAK